MMLPSDADDLVALGAFAGAQVLVLVFSIIVANAYRERSLLVHGAAVTLALLAMQLSLGGNAGLAQAAVLGLLALDGLQLRELVSHAGALRNPRRALIVTCLGILPLLAIAGYFANAHVLLPAIAVWGAVVVVIMLRAWPQSQPWARWLVLGQAALVSATIWLGTRSLASAQQEPALVLGALFTVWAAAVFLATAWRNRIFGETRVRIDARNMTDPLTGLLMPLMFYDRVQAVRNLMIRYGHPSVLVLVHVENVQALTSDYGPEVGESILPVAADRIRATLREGDVAARLSHSRIAVLAEGMAPAEAAANVASRILVAGMKEPLPLAPTEFLHFRIILAGVPVDAMPPKALMQRLSDKLDEQVRHAGERRIVTLTGEELLA